MQTGSHPMSDPKAGPLDSAHRDGFVRNAGSAISPHAGR